MIEITFSKEDIKALRHSRYHHPHPRVQQRMEAVLLKSQGLHRQQIEQVAGISSNTLRTYIKMYKKGGIEGLKQINFYRPQSDLASHKDTLEEYFRKHPFPTIAEARAKIKELTGIERSPTQVRTFLKSIGIALRKVGVVPAKADIEKQEEFKNNQLEPRLEEAKEGKRVVLFMDAAHFVYGAFLGMLWCFERIFIKSPSGRNRYNVLGAVNAVTHELLLVTNETYINAYSVCDLLMKTAQRYVGIPITIVLDNARYQNCALVKDLALSLNIELLFLPAYSPNLNLIERLWKFVKKQCLYSKYYAAFLDFHDAISNCLNETQTTYKKDLDSLLTLNFQTFKKEQFVNA
jgi:transposase